MTFCSQNRRATKLRHTPLMRHRRNPSTRFSAKLSSPMGFNGRSRRIQTLDTWFWRPLLYQLSYTPTMAESTGFEPAILTYNALAVRRFQPLSQLSIGAGPESRTQHRGFCRPSPHRVDIPQYI